MIHIFRGPVLATVEIVEPVTKGLWCIIHNYLMADRLTDEGNIYCPNNFVDQKVRSKIKNREWRLVVENNCGLFQKLLQCFCCKFEQAGIATNSH